MIRTAHGEREEGMSERMSERTAKRALVWFELSAYLMFILILAGHLTTWKAIFATVGTFTFAFTCAFIRGILGVLLGEK